MIIAKIPKANFRGVFLPQLITGSKTLEAMLETALAKPIGSRTLYEIARRCRRATILVDDWTRPTPAQKILAPVVHELSQGGILEKNITLVYATGLHRILCDREKVVLKVGKNMMNRLGRVIIHDAYKEKDLAFLGTSSLGTPILINKAVCESDLVISIGNIGINFTGGYSGGGKNVFPGTAGVASIEHNHSFAIAADSPHQAGKTDGNYCRQDIEEIAQRVGLKFIINTVINREGKIATVVAGTPKTAFSTGTTVARKTHEARVESPLDIAVVHPGSATGSYDEAQKYRYLSFVLLVATLIAPSLKEQGTLILVAPNVRAWAPPFLAQETPPVEWLQYSLRELASMIASRKISPLRLANWAYAIRWVLTRREVLLVNDSLPSDQCIRYGFKQYTHIEDALSHAFSNQGACAQVGVFPEGAATIPVMDTNEKQLTTDELRRNGCGECQ